jgi:hypothetical protein
MKPRYNEKEIEELNDLHFNLGFESGVYNVVKFLKEKYGWSDVHDVLCEIRKEFNSQINNKRKNFSEHYTNSTLTDKIIKRMDWMDQHKKKKETT